MKLGKKKLQELKDRKISIKELNDRYFINSQYKVEDENVLNLLNENVCSFQELVDKFKSTKDEYNDPSLWKLLGSEKLFEELIENNKLTSEDLKYLLNKIDGSDELDYLCDNTSLIKHILNELVLDKKLVDKFNRKIENDDWCKDHNIHTVFDRIEYYNRDIEEILKLNELNKKIYTLNDFNLNLDQKLKLSEVLKNNEQAKNTLIQIIDNHLEDQYDFEILKNLLKKDSEKKKIKMNI